MIRENRRPLLAFALVATMCALTLAQGVRSEALQGFVAAQVPQVIVGGAQLVSRGAAEAEPADGPAQVSPAAPTESLPTPTTTPKPSAQQRTARHGAPRGHQRRDESPGRTRGKAAPPPRTAPEVQPPKGSSAKAHGKAKPKVKVKAHSKAKTDGKAKAHGKAKAKAHGKAKTKGQGKTHGKGKGKGKGTG